MDHMDHMDHMSMTMGTATTSAPMSTGTGMSHGMEGMGHDMGGMGGHSMGGSYVMELEHNRRMYIPPPFPL
ncbi:hypothetical protein EYZ11_008549 [Aspergillus tanneri]|uniref:Uncharacterized protein n=1 Tax=Aspergillus tanneri TaxID=1220188 RepID=A0A4S3JA76_9EURO|nr:hypothetical protein EYZ11_008549 [Aspergillus tanneri]